MPITKDERAKILEKFSANFQQLEPTELPPLANQLFSLTTNVSLVLMVLFSLQKYFHKFYYTKLFIDMETDSMTESDSIGNAMFFFSMDKCYYNLYFRSVSVFWKRCPRGGRNNFILPKQKYSVLYNGGTGRCKLSGKFFYEMKLATELTDFLWIISTLPCYKLQCWVRYIFRPQLLDIFCCFWANVFSVTARKHFLLPAIVSYLSLAFLIKR